MENPILTTDATNVFSNGAALGAMLNKGHNDNGLITALAANGGMGGAWNNPFVYLVWMMFANRWMGDGSANSGTNAQIQALQGVVQDNHNSDLLMQAVGGNTNAVQQLAVALNTGFDVVNSAICGVRNSITEANGNIQLAAQQMISNNNIQTAGLATQIGNVGNQVNTSILTQGFQNQLANCQQTNAIQNGFTQLGFQAERNACEIKEQSLLNTQKIIDTLSNHWSTADQTKIAQLEARLATSEQTQTLLSAIASKA